MLLRKSWYWIGLLGLSFWSTKPGLAQPLEARVSRYTRFLQEKGWSIAAETPNEIQFWEDGQVYHLEISQDTQFFRLVLPAVYTLAEAPSECQVLKVCEEVNSQIKVCKALIQEEEVDLVFEILLVSPDDFRLLFSRALTALQTAKQFFVEKISD
ncbi:MAG: hypothetical protein OHK0053_36770 [Microscillaceae bacterium]